LKWRDVPVADRAASLKKLAEVLRSEKRRYAELITREMGKPIKEALAEVEKCAVLADYYAGNAVSFLSPEEIKTEAKKSYVTFQPLGIVLAIMPWNFPFWQAVLRRPAASGLADGVHGSIARIEDFPGTVPAVSRGVA
jgi:succinate-semialdehyde dehydrogenase/glutarate-semialdehyde dehydrogenase